MDDLTSSLISCSLFLWIKFNRQKEYCILLMPPYRRRWQNPEWRVSPDAFKDEIPFRQQICELVDSTYLISKMYNIVPLWQEFTFEEIKSSLDNSRYPRETGVLIWEFNFLSAWLRDRFPRAYLSFYFWFELECMTSIIKSQRSSAGIPSILKSVSRQIISDSAERWDTHCDC